MRTALVIASWAVTGSLGFIAGIDAAPTRCPTRAVTHVRTIRAPALTLQNGVWVAERRIATTEETQR